ncbi:MAG: hypothetical protein HS111_26935 [Kofleriaceae bacterium]|nr:hypothetical protein [Kofleriaceae bacterium]MCL4226384.1 hypothetical protein [Myxococcales bacterium]
MGRLAILTLLLAGCTPDDGRPPLARIDLSPPAILENDGYQTAVTLDGTASADPLDDPDGARPLTFAWQILDDEHRFEGSRPTSPAPVVRMRGDRPATIVLTVTDADGLSATTVARMQLTVR